MTASLFAGTDASRPAVIMDSGATVTYGELRDDAHRLAQYFRAIGLRPGDHIALCVENHPRFMTVVWGAYAAGLIYTPISTRSTVGEASYIIRDCGARVFVTSAALRELAAELATATPAVSVRLMLDGATAGYTSLQEAIAPMPATPVVDGVAGRDMLYSSGTTGRPKGVVVPFPEGPVGQHGLVTRITAARFGFGPDTVYLCPAPLYHAAPLRYTVAVHQLGGTAVVMEKFDAETALELIERYRVTASQWVPTMFTRLLRIDPRTRARYDLSSHRLAVHAAAPCPVAVKEQMLDWWGPIIHEYYSGTEGVGSTHIGPEEWLAHKGSVGRAVDSVIHVVGEDGAEVPPDVDGLVYFEGRTAQYHNDPAKTASARHPRGWMTLGDIGHVDEDGYLYLTDRQADTINTGGVNVYPQEVENVLILHPSVRDVAVIGVPNMDFGEEVKAVVQLEDFADPNPLLEQELIAYCRAQLAGPKCPRSVDFVPELPRQPNGKLYKRLLRHQYWQGRVSRLV